jgi:hypothetical protein
LEYKIEDKLEKQRFMRKPEPTTFQNQNMRKETDAQKECTCKI